MIGCRDGIYTTDAADDGVGTMGVPQSDDFLLLLPLAVSVCGILHAT